LKDLSTNGLLVARGRARQFGYFGVKFLLRDFLAVNNGDNLARGFLATSGEDDRDGAHACESCSCC